jgi:very-short-patch-repair endonuclease
MQYRRIRGTTPEIEAAARHLRANPTPAEAKLWEALKGKQLNGLKFRQQHPVEQFILDFYCPSCKLVIEIDGEIHGDRQEYDQARTEKLNTLGYQVIRFSNTEVMNNFQSVLSQILQITVTKSTFIGEIYGS